MAHIKLLLPLLLFTFEIKSCFVALAHLEFVGLRLRGLLASDPPRPDQKCEPLLSAWCTVFINMIEPLKFTQLVTERSSLYIV